MRLRTSLSIPLPILQYTAPQAFVSGGALRGESSQQEVISLPRTFTPAAGGGLELELSPSLAGSLLSALEAMEVPNYSMSAEASLSYLLPNIEVHRALNNSGLSDPALSERVETNLNASVSRLQSLQNADGGWSWWGTDEPSDPYISAYVLFGLIRAKNISEAVSQDTLDRAVTYLQGAQTDVTLPTQSLLQSKARTLAVEVSGRLQPGITAKDVILAVIAKIGVGGATGHVVEYRGSAIRALDVEERMTVCNMSIEAGARAGMVGPDDTTFSYLSGRPQAPAGAAWDRAVARWRGLPTDEGAAFDQTVTLDAATLTPMITYGTNPGMVAPISARVPERPGDAVFARSLEYMGLAHAQKENDHRHKDNFGNRI